MRLIALLALAFTVAGCGSSPTSPTTTPDKPTTPVVQPPVSPTQPTPPGSLATMKQDVAAAYKSVTAIGADYETHQKKGSETYFAKVHMTFAKPRKLRLDIRTSSDALLSGAMVVWMGGDTLKGRKDIGFIPIKQEHKLSEKPNLRGWLYNQTDYDAMISALNTGLTTGKVLGTSKVGGQSVTMIEFKSTLPGASIERIGVDMTRKLPIYREFRESANGAPVFSVIYTNIQLNPKVAPDAFSI